MDAFERIQTYANVIEQDCPFQLSRGLTQALLSSSTDYFEQNCLREGEAHEISLFRTGTPPKGNIDARSLASDAPDNAWHVASSRRAGPQRRAGVEKATPLKAKLAGKQPERQDPVMYLNAALKLLEI